MARRRNGKQSLKGLFKGKSISSRVFPIVKTVSAPIAFLEQITAKDRQDLGNQFSQAGYGTQLKLMSNIVLGRLAGISPFPKLYTAPQTINPAGVLNKWTNAGLIGIAYKVLGGGVNKISRDMGMGSIVPETSKIGSIGKSVLIGGALGGFFDDAPAKAQIITRQIPAQNRVLTNTTYNRGSDSTGSSF